MGIDFTFEGERDEPGYAHDVAPHWSYSGFNRFRERLADSAGLGDLREYEGFGGDREWPSALDEPLVPLLHHSDCDGELDPIACDLVAPRLREVVERWPADDYDRIHGEKLATYMERCAARSLNLIFC